MVTGHLSRGSYGYGMLRDTYLEVPMVTGDLDSSDFLVILEVPMVTGDLDSSDSRGFSWLRET